MFLLVCFMGLCMAAQQHLLAGAVLLQHKGNSAAASCYCTLGTEHKGNHGAFTVKAHALHLTYLLFHHPLRPPPFFPRHRHRHQCPYHPWHRLSCPRLPSHRPPPSSCSSQPRSNLSIFLQKHQLQLCHQ